jgi:hypothetical protein
VGAVEVNEMRWALWPTTTDCWTCAAGWTELDPAWLASMVHVPGPMRSTVPARSEHTWVLAGSTRRLTVRPELEVAATAYVLPTPGLAGGVVVNEIVWDCSGITIN